MTGGNKKITNDIMQVYPHLFVTWSSSNAHKSSWSVNWVGWDKFSAYSNDSKGNFARDESIERKFKWVFASKR